MWDSKIIAIMCLQEIRIQDENQIKLLPIELIREIMEFTGNRTIEDNETFRHNVKLWFDKSSQNQEARQKMINIYGHISKWETKNITDMSRVFLNIDNFHEDISGWDVSNVTNMTDMFWGCNNLSVDLSRWNTSKVQSIEGMFGNSKITSDLNISSWDVSNVTSFYNMFRGCTCRLINISGWDTSNVRTMEGMFGNSNITILSDISGWDVSNVTSFYNMFWGCTCRLINISGWDTSNVLTMEGMFGNSNITILSDISGWDVSNVTNMKDMFYRFGNITFNVLSWDISNLQFADHTFFGCFTGENVDILEQILNHWYVINPNLDIFRV